MSGNNKRIFLLTIILITTFILYLLINQSETNESFGVIEITNYTDILINNNPPSNTLYHLELHHVIQTKPCDSNLLVVIVVTSYFGNVETRSAMRRAFSNEELAGFGVRRVFLLGTKQDDAFVKQSSINDESDRFGDILQGNFQEAYRNLTYKHLMGLKWASDYCKGAKYVIKMDDDTVIDVNKVVKYLNETTLPKKYLLAGYLLKNMVPIRKKANKWYVTYEEYGKSTYPTFLSGWFYITNPKTAHALVALSRYRDFFWIDDTLVTGILAEMVPIRHFYLNNLFTVHSEFLQCCIHDVKSYNYECDFMVGPNGGDNNLFYAFNEAVKKCHVGKCGKRKKDIDDTCVAEKRFNFGKGKSVVETYRMV